MHTALINSYLITEELPYTALDIQVVSKSLRKTGSLLKLQQVMGHSDMTVSLTYLRALEVKQYNLVVTGLCTSW